MNKGLFVAIAAAASGLGLSVSQEAHHVIDRAPNVGGFLFNPRVRTAGTPGPAGVASVNARHERRRGTHGSSRIRAFKRLKNRARNGS